MLRDLRDYGRAWLKYGTAKLLHDGGMIEKAATTFVPSDLGITGPYVMLGDTLGEATDAYSNSWVAYSCMRRLELDAGGIPLIAVTDPDDLETEVPESHPVRQMLENPNPYFSSSEFVESLINWMSSRGEYFILFDNPVRPTMMYQYTEPLNWRVIPSSDPREILGWEYHRGNEFYREPVDALVHHRYIDPSRPYRGQSPITAAARNYNIDVGVDQLQESVIARGGERSVIYEVDVKNGEAEPTPEQRRQMKEELRARRVSKNRVGRDILLPNRVTIVDPRFIEDDLKILESQKMQPDKICAVFGLSLSLLGFEDIDKYATFQGRERVYFQQTLIPILKGVEKSLTDHFQNNLPSAYNCFVRFDTRGVKALQDSENERFEMAVKAHAGGLPWAALNDRFDLNLNLDLVPGNETTLVSASMLPIETVLEVTSSPVTAGTGETGGKADVGGETSAPGRPALTNKMIVQRARRDRLQRDLRLLGIEKSLRNKWRLMVNDQSDKTEKALPEDLTVKNTEAAIKKSFKGYDDTAADLASKHHERAALEGEESIVELADGKMSDAEARMYRKAHSWSPGVIQFLRKRHNFIKDDTAVGLFEDVLEHSVQAVRDGKTRSDVIRIMRTRFHRAPGGINRGVTIARTEVGTAYSVARFSEMKVQGFEETRWLTAADENVRPAGDPKAEFDHHQCNDEVRAIGKKFPCGLLYPMEEGGDPGNVINCRCEAIPEV